MRNYNSQTFTPEQIANGELRDLIDYLMNFNIKSEKSFMDIHVTSDSYCQIVEWAEVHYDFQYECGRFHYVNGDEEIYKEVIFPDNTSIFVPILEAEDTFNDWLKEHPGWYKDSWGRWRDASEDVTMPTYDSDDETSH